MFVCVFASILIVCVCTNVCAVLYVLYHAIVPVHCECLFCVLCFMLCPCAFDSLRVCLLLHWCTCNCL